MRLAQIVLLLALAAGLALFFAEHHETPLDWRSCFEPAGRQLLVLRSPYTVSCFHNPSWAALVFAPFALAGRASFAAWLFAGMIAMGVVVRRMGAAWWVIPLIWLSPPVIALLRQGQIDWLVYLSIVSPPWLGVFLVLIKPQVGIGLAALLTVRGWREGGLVRVVGLWMPPALVMALSFLAWGNWLARSAPLKGVFWNVSLWPLGIPFGIAVLLLALRRNSIPLALLVGPLVSPYVAYYSLTGVVLAFAHWKWLLALLVGLPWAIISILLVTRLVLR